MTQIRTSPINRTERQGPSAVSQLIDGLVRAVVRITGVEPEIKPFESELEALEDEYEQTMMRIKARKRAVDEYLVCAKRDREVLVRVLENQSCAEDAGRLAVRAVTAFNDSQEEAIKWLRKI